MSSEIDAEKIENPLLLIIPRGYRDDKLSETTAYAIVECEAAFPSSSCGRLNDFQYSCMVNPGTVVSKSRIRVS